MLKKQTPWFFIVIFGMVSAVLIVGFYFKELQNIRSEKVTAWTEDSAADCAVVLTGSRGRVKDGLALLSRGSIRKLIISGVYEKAGLRDIYPEWPYYGDLNPDDVILEKYSQTTFGNALQTFTLVEAFKCKDLILITSQTHMYRAYKTFRANFPKEFHIIKRSVLGGDAFEEYEEAIKSLFYSIWTY
jgi:uncharacterized SAM-binding protein YcdF (DUF218 family)